MGTTWRLATALCALAVCPALAGIGHASAAPVAAEDSFTAVAVGDAYISGEGGMWRGNAAGQSDGSGIPQELWNRTDRRELESRSANDIYGGTWSPGDGKTPGCHRSDVSEITGVRGTRLAGGTIGTTHNLACSGAETTSFTQDYVGAKRQRSQIAQLRDIVVQDRSGVKAVVISVGASDIQLAETMHKCAESWKNSRYCSTDDTVTSQLNSRLSTLTGKVSTVVKEVKAVFDKQSVPQPRIILQSYPNPLASGAPADTAQSDENQWSRWNNYGCPFYNKDLQWFSTTVFPSLTQSLKQAAKNEGVDFLDMSKTLSGHELCSTDAHTVFYASDGSVYDPPAAKAEWARYLPRREQTDSEKQESLHPNFYGQQAQKACLRSFLGAADRAQGVYQAKCESGRGVDPVDVTLTPTN